MTLYGLLACTTAGGDFLGGSGRFEPTPYGDTADTATSDTADTADTGGSEGDDGAPVLSGEEVHWEDYPEFGIVLEFNASFTDDGDDILGGTCFIDLYANEEYKDAAELTVSENPEDSGGKVCLVDGTTITFAIQGLDDSESAGIDIEIQDTSKNTSATYTAYTDGE